MNYHSGFITASSLFQGRKGSVINGFVTNNNAWFMCLTDLSILCGPGENVDSQVPH